MSWHEGEVVLQREVVSSYNAEKTQKSVFLQHNCLMETFFLTAVAEETETAQETAGRHGRRRRPAVTRMQETGFGQPNTELSLCTKCVFKILAS